MLLRSLLLCALLCACSGPPKRKPLAPAPSVSTVRVERAVRAAADRTERVVDTVRGIQSRTKDADTAAELAVVVGELVRVKADLRDATDRSAEVVVQSEKLEQWGVAQQQTAEANAEGWRKAETVAKSRGRWIGTSASIALGALTFLVCSKFNLPPPHTWIATGIVATGAYPLALYVTA